jgi:hypothetical protein
MRGVKEDRYGGKELLPFSMVARAMTRMTGGPSTAITEAIVEGGGSAGTKRSKCDAPPQAWTICPLSGLRAPPPPTGGTRRGIVVNVVAGGGGGFGRLQLGHALGTLLSIMSKKDNDAGGDHKGGCTITDPRQRGKVWVQTTKCQ